MKLLYSALLLIILLPLSLLGNDTRIFVSGYVSDISSGNPVAGHEVTLKFKNQDPPYLFFDKVITNEFGYFSFLFDLPFSKGILHVSTVDCSNQLITNTLQFTPAQTSFMTNFAICNSQQSSICRSDFIWVYDPSQSNKVNFKQSSMGNIDEWLWDFGDGNTSTEPDPVHFYLDDGHYEVCLSISGNNGTCNDTYCNTIDSNDDTLVQARFTYFNIPGNQSSVQFYDLSLGNVTSWQWSFGDGRSSAVQNPLYHYSTPGTYTVCLVAMKPGNQSDTICQSIEVSPVGNCSASFLTFPDPLDPMTLHFVDISAGDPEGWFWDFGDGQTSTLQNPVHSFSLEGIYTIKLTTTNQTYSCQSSFVQIETVSLQPDYLPHFNAFNQDGDDLTWRFIDMSTGNPDRWFWDFGDGSTSELKHPTHNFATPGTYTVCQTISDQPGNFTESYCKTIYAGITQECKAFFTFTPDVTNPLIYHFTNASHGDTLQIEWDFGDGNTSSQENPTHIFEGTGIYRVCITVTDNFGWCSDNFCHVITVAPDVPLQAGFEPFIFPENPFSVQFVNQTLGKHEIKIWSFGDGAYSFESCPQHIYASEGSFWVCLHVFDLDSGLTDQFWQTIEISTEPFCISDFIELHSLYNPLVVRFADLSSGEIVNRNWNFDDGNSSTLKNPVHSFSDGGNFDVCLDVSDYTGSCNHQFCKEITIEFEPMCEANFDFLPAQDQSLIIQFNDLSQGNMNTWEWDFGDGATSLLQHPTHAFADSGFYTVTLSVSHTDSLVWCNHTFSRQIYVFAPMPECYADFIAIPDSGINMPNFIHFKDLSAGQPDEWLWDFGDGSTSTVQHPSHQYDGAGTYQVTLNVIRNNPFGASCSDTKTMEFISPEYFHIGGFIFSGNFPINNPAPTGDTAEIMLYRYRNNMVIPLDTAQFTEYGYYSALYLLSDHYLIKAQLTSGSSNFQKYFPTYFGNELTWQNAEYCFVSDSNHYHLDIHLGILPLMQQGIGSIAGSVIYQSFTHDQIVPAFNTAVLLFDEQLQPINYTFTGSSGDFGFDELPFGTYYLAAESAGKVCEKLMVTITETNPVVKDIEIEIFDAGSTPVTEDPVNDVISVRVFPNPVLEKFFVEIFQTTDFPAELLITNISGQTILRRKLVIKSGLNQFELPANQLKPGVYFLRLRDLKSGLGSSVKFIK
ncbi:MAG: PKD domain-containing protein [Bacteroidales bacterium]|nr:PKD domain-containing protein [Bacteroidales bacterium]